MPDETEREKTSVLTDVKEGLSYVLGHPVLRNISIMMALVNFVGSTTGAQLVLFAKERLNATDSQIGLLFSAGSVGVVILSLAAGPLRKRWTFSKVALTALMIGGILTVALAFTRMYVLALIVWGLASNTAGVVKQLDELGAAFVDTPTAKGPGWRPHIVGAPTGTGDKQWVEKINELYNALDTFIPQPVRETDKPFLLPVEDVFSITGRGTVATGRIDRGIIKVGEEVELVGFGSTKKSVVTGISWRAA